jgi:hypothetical protein
VPLCPCGHSFHGTFSAYWFWTWRLVPMWRPVSLFRRLFAWARKTLARETEASCAGLAAAVRGSRFSRDGLVQLGGVEPPTSGSTIRNCSYNINGLSHGQPRNTIELPQKSHDSRRSILEHGSADDRSAGGGDLCGCRD